MSPLVLDDPVEAPEGIGAAEAVDRSAGEPASLAQAGTDPPVQKIGLRTRGSAAQPRARPLPGRVDVVGERHGKPCTPPTGRLDAEPVAEPLERWIEWVERGVRGPKPAVLVARGIPLFDTGEVEERLCQLVAFRPPALVNLLPGLRSIGNVVAEPELARPDRVENPPGLPLDRCRDQLGTLSLDSRSEAAGPDASQRATSR